MSVTHRLRTIRRKKEHGLMIKIDFESCQILNCEKCVRVKKFQAINSMCVNHLKEFDIIKRWFY